MTKFAETLMGDTRKAYEALVRSVEDEVFDAEQVWGVVYLDNALPSGWSYHKFAGHLSDLKAQGLYAPEGDDGVFGLVRTE